MEDTSNNGLLLYFYDSQGYYGYREKDEKYEGYYLLEVFFIGGNLTQLCLYIFFLYYFDLIKY